MRKHWTTLLKLGVTLAGLALVLTRFDLGRILIAVQQAAPLWLFAGFTLVNASLVLRAYRWLLLVRGLGAVVPFRRLVELYFVGSFFNAFLPSGFGGDVVRVLEIAQNVPSSIAAGTVLLDRLTGLIMLFALALFALPFRASGFPAELAGGIAVICVVGLFGGFILLEGSLLRRVVGWLPARLANAGDGFLSRFSEAVEQCGRRAIVGALAVSIAFNLLQAVWWYTTGLALGYEIDYVYYLLVVPVLSLMLILPSIGGLGVREVAAPLLFAPAGLSPEQAIALTLVVFGLERLSGLLGGLLYLYAIVRDRTRQTETTGPVKRP